MGWRTWPGYELLQGECLDCFAPGKTPKKIYLAFSGLKLCKRSLAAGHEPPPKTGFICENMIVAPCHWTNDSALWGADFIADAAINLMIIPRFQDYFFAPMDGCQTSLANVYTNDHCQAGLCDAYGGRVQAFWRPETDSPSVRGIMKDINMEPHRNTMFEGFPVDDTNAVAKYCRTKDATNIKLKFDPTKLPKGVITAWYEPIEDIPDGWYNPFLNMPPGWILCDGKNGTPDLRDRFVVGAGNDYDPDKMGWSLEHKHTFTGDGHTHVIPHGYQLAAGTDYKDTTLSENAAGITDKTNHLPPYHSLCYIMKT